MKRLKDIMEWFNGESGGDLFLIIFTCLFVSTLSCWCFGSIRDTIVIFISSIVWLAFFKIFTPVGS